MTSKSIDIPGYANTKDLAKSLSNLQEDYLADLFNMLSNELAIQAKKKKEAGLTELAEAFDQAIESIGSVVLNLRKVHASGPIRSVRLGTYSERIFKLYGRIV